MSSLKIIHAADFHLDSPFRNLPGDRAEIRREEQRNLLRRLVALTVREKADLVLLPGDLLDSGRVYGETGELLIRTLDSMPCPVVIAPGNHDFYSRSSIYATIPDTQRLKIFRRPEIESFSFPQIGVEVYGAAFTDSVSPSLLEGFTLTQTPARSGTRSPVHSGTLTPTLAPIFAAAPVRVTTPSKASTRTPNTLRLLCIHGELTTAQSRYNPITPTMLEQSGFDYAALGHIHLSSGLKKYGGCYCSWPGCPEGRGFDETGDRYVNIVELDRDNGSVSLRRESIAAHRYQLLNVDISTGEPLLAVHRLLPDNTERDIYRITLTGETPSAPDITSLYNNLEGMFFSLELLDGTRPVKNIWDTAGTDTLRGIFLRKLREKYNAAETDEERRKIEQAVRWGLSAMDQTEVSGNGN